MAPGVPVSGVLAGGEVRGGDGPVPHDLRRLLIKMGGDVLEGQQRSTAGDEQWRRPCWGVVVPGEGPANMGEQGTRGHRGSAGMLSLNSIWIETGWRGALDGGVELGFSSAVMAAGVLQARAMEGGEGGAGSLQGVDVVLMVLLIGAERPCIDRSTGGRAKAEEGGSPALRSGDPGGGNWNWITW
jgi:hypothetical protein